MYVHVGLLEIVVRLRYELIMCRTDSCDLGTRRRNIITQSVGGDDQPRPHKDFYISFRFIPSCYTVCVEPFLILPPERTGCSAEAARRNESPTHGSLSPHQAAGGHPGPQEASGPVLRREHEGGLGGPRGREDDAADEAHLLPRLGPLLRLPPEAREDDAGDRVRSSR